LKDKGLGVSLADLSRDIEERDRRDAGRAASPLTRTEDAVLVDSTGRTIDAVVAEVLELALARGLRPAGR
jgi:CMP/dCMP kinase